MEINEIIKRIRVEQRFTQYDMAEKLGVVQGVYQKIEAGKTEITFARLEELAKIFGMSVTEVINYPSTASDRDLDEIEKKLAQIGERANLLESLSDERLKRLRQIENIIKEYMNHVQALLDNYESQEIQEALKSFFAQNLSNQREVETMRQLLETLKKSHETTRNLLL